MSRDEITPDDRRRPNMEGKLLPSRGKAEGFMRESYLSWSAQGRGSGPRPHLANGKPRCPSNFRPFHPLGPGRTPREKRLRFPACLGAGLMRSRKWDVRGLRARGKWRAGTDGGRAGEPASRRSQLWLRPGSGGSCFP